MITVRKHYHYTGAGVSFYNWYYNPETNCYTNIRVWQTKAKRSSWQGNQLRARWCWQGDNCVKYDTSAPSSRANAHPTTRVIPCQMMFDTVLDLLEWHLPETLSTLCACNWRKNGWNKGPGGRMLGKHWVVIEPTPTPPQRTGSEACTQDTSVRRILTMLDLTTRYQLALERVVKLKVTRF